MTVLDWLESRSPKPPAVLLARVIEALGADVGTPEERLPETCLAASKRMLESLIADERFGRDSATDLLAVDALMTYAYEYAGMVSSRVRVQALAAEGARMIGTLSTPHV